MDRRRELIEKVRAVAQELGVEKLPLRVVLDRTGIGHAEIYGLFHNWTQLCRASDGSWRRVRIEFEFRSRAFRDHRHDPTDCDLIVCWTHNWRDCPIELLELSAAIAAAG